MWNEPDPMEQYGLCGALIVVIAAIVGGAVGLLLVGFIARMLAG